MAQSPMKSLQVRHVKALRLISIVLLCTFQIECAALCAQASPVSGHQTCTGFALEPDRNLCYFLDHVDVSTTILINNATDDARAYYDTGEIDFNLSCKRILIKNQWKRNCLQESAIPTPGAVLFQYGKKLTVKSHLINVHIRLIFSCTGCIHLQFFLLYSSSRYQHHSPLLYPKSSSSHQAILRRHHWGTHAFEGVCLCLWCNVPGQALLPSLPSQWQLMPAEKSLLLWNCVTKLHARPLRSQNGLQSRYGHCTK